MDTNEKPKHGVVQMRILLSHDISNAEDRAFCEGAPKELLRHVVCKTERIFSAFGKKC